MKSKIMAEGKYKITALLVVLVLVSVGLYFSIQDRENRPENSLNETEQDVEAVEAYNNTKKTTQSGNSFGISLQTPPKRGGSTDIYFMKNGEGIEDVPIYLDGDYKGDTQDGLAAGRAFVNVPDTEKFEISIEYSGQNYTETFETMTE